MHRAVAAARVSAAATIGLCVLVAASGWLYVVQPSAALPGPPVADALPLDELSRRSAVPLLVFAGVWAAAALLLATLARFGRAERLTAGLLLGAGVGLWGYLSTGTSLWVVRQVPPGEAFSAAARLPAVFVPAVMAGLAGAVLGRRSRSAGSGGPLVLGLLVGAAGVLDLAHVLLTAPQYRLLGSFAPGNLNPLTSAIAPIGLALVLCARGLARRKRRAWQLAVGLLAASVFLHVLHRFDEGAIVAGLLAVALVARRHDFACPGDPGSHPRVALRVAAALGFLYSYGAVALWANRVVVDHPFSLHLAFEQTSSALLGLSLAHRSRLSGDFGGWFPLSMLILGLLSLCWVLAGWLAPWRYRHRQEAHERELVRALVDAWGADTLAPFVLRADKSYFLDADARSFLAYKVVGGVAIVSGDPIGAPDALAPLVRGFIAFAHERDWRVAVLGASEARIGLYRAHGLHALYHGDEAVVETGSFSLEGRAIRKVRQSVHRLEKVGYTQRVLRPGELDRRLRRELESIASAWRGDEPERGFVMALDALFRLDDEHAVFVIGFAPDGAPAGFLHFAVTTAGSALSLSSMPRLRSTPNGFNEWLVCGGVAWAREHGFERVSLNFAPFAALLAPGADLSRLQRLERRALLSLKGHFQLDNLLVFNRKFLPTWQRRFVVYERRRDLLRVGVAALAAEAYLPFTGRRE